MSKAYITATTDGILLHLRVSPGAKRSSIGGCYGESAIKLNVAAPPTDGKANAEAERFLAELLGVPRRDVAVLQGASSRDKLVLVRGAGQAETRELLSDYLL